ncbi:hypothetical protein GS634_12630 [Ruegeria atlantica]|uniref:Uncharacterized protein n=1 Tax=Ruegeria atlantica TaxID=81569 RepID=A0AA90Z305_9RHOB|nr:hypothetical protein [Ruegeria atlantica]NOE18967.1 hypothetical protein [Ruegeria atlantica]
MALDDTDTTLAAQPIAGVAYDINASTTLTVDARYARAFDVLSQRLAPNGALTGNVEDDLDTFSVSFGLRHNF